MKISRGDSLDRYYVFKLFGYGVFFHCIHHSDTENTFHTHPWNGLSIIFGHYWECYLTAEGQGRWHYRRGFNWIKARRPHNVRIDRPVWTLFIHGPKCNQWEVIAVDGTKVVAPWEGDQGHKSYKAALSQ